MQRRDGKESGNRKRSGSKKRPDAEKWIEIGITSPRSVNHNERSGRLRNDL